MPKRNSKPAHLQFTELGLDPATWTDAMRIAHKQRWTNLPVDEKVSVLRDRIANVAAVMPPTVAELAAIMGCSDEQAVAERKRLKRNAAVNAWRERTQLQAALDARELKFAALRAKRGTTVDAGAGKAAMAKSA